jgi:flavodoxin
LKEKKMNMYYDYAANAACPQRPAWQVTPIGCKWAQSVFNGSNSSCKCEVKNYRKLFMKRRAFWAFIFILLGVNMELQAQTSNDKILVVFFSWSGNAKTLAGQIAQVTKGDLFEIKTITAYPDNYNDCIAVAKQEQERNARPDILRSVINMAQYKTVFLCYPIWWGTMPMAVFTFLESYDLSGKSIYPLVTHGSSRFGRSLDDIKKLCPKAVLSEGLSVSAFDRNPNDNPVVTAPNRDVTSWLLKLGITN